ncbi:hypothetical protein JCM10908_002616 [Rhodotorula pacifica]|uniref:uncharacterized protein n=1 Tax=Rhodotorula pacifica TaxID=1495444 RepID=UPI003170F309
MHFKAAFLGLALALQSFLQHAHALPVWAGRLDQRDTTVPAAATNVEDPVAAALASRMSALNQQLTKGVVVSPMATSTSDDRVFLGTMRAKNIKDANSKPTPAVNPKYRPSASQTDSVLRLRALQDAEPLRRSADSVDPTTSPAKPRPQSSTVQVRSEAAFSGAGPSPTSAFNDSNAPPPLARAEPVAPAA